jgi:hypothetical protein
MTSVRGINWAALGANVGSTVLFTLLRSAPSSGARTLGTGCWG